ncbi:MAG: hypothetical protein A2063_04900 [Gallionellales bacterium GWA2_60_142]|nr:MAG: hypothetical protein A2063_04900 [Gallionellales bacterium GWA2_60_142]
MLERPVLQRHVDPVRRRARILGGEMLLKVVVIDVHRGMHRRPLPLDNARAAAPRQELRIILHAIHQIKHLLRAMRYQYRFLHQGHCLPKLPNQRLVE